MRNYSEEEQKRAQEPVSIPKKQVPSETLDKSESDPGRNKEF